jgi:hypothetical protein
VEAPKTDGSTHFEDPFSSEQSQLQAVRLANSCQTAIVNILGVDETTISFCSKLFTKQHVSKTAVSSRKSLRLAQLIGYLDKQKTLSWIRVSKTASGDGLKTIVFSSSIAPLLVIVPVNEPFSERETKWTLELRELLVESGASRRPLIFIGICNQSDDRALQQAMLSKLGVQTKHIYWLSDPANSSVTEEIKTTVLQLVPPSLSAYLEVEKLVLLERCHNVKLLPSSKLPGSLSSSSHSSIAQYLEKRGIVMSFPLQSAYEIAIQRGPISVQSTTGTTETILSTDILTGDKSINHNEEVQIYLEPKTFSDKVNELIALSQSVYMEVNNSLVPSAQHGLIPKDKLKAKVDSSQLSLLPTLHRSSLLLDPLLVAFEHPDCSEVVFSKATTELSKQNNFVLDARHYFLAPSCLSEESRMSSLPGYCAVAPLTFRSPGSYQNDIPISVFYQLVAYLMVRYSSSVKSYKYGARFHVGPLHILEVTYETTYMKVIVYVYGQKQVQSSVTSDICASVRNLISVHLETLSKANGTLMIHPAALIDDSTSVYPDFVDLSGVSILSVRHEMVTIGGRLFSPSIDFCQWFGGSEQVPSTIQKNFVDLVDQIDAERAAGWLYQKQFLDGNELDKILGQDVNTRCQLLLRLLEKKGVEGLKAVDAVLQENSLKTHRIRGDPGIQTSLGLNVAGTHVSDRQEATSHQQPHLTPLQSLGERHGAQTGDQRVSGIAQQSNIMSSLPPLLDNRNEQQLNQLDPSSNPRITTTGMPSAIQQQASTHSLTPPQPPATQETGRRTNESELSVISPRMPLAVKEDPEIHPIFESKYWHVERATNYFNETPLRDGGKRLGVGSFGTVFHGVLHTEDGQKFDVAVKRLKKASSLNPDQVKLSRKQFGVEMNILTRYLHKNVVRLLGFSSDGPELCLIYEYMQNGALSHRLDCKDNSAPLDWKIRLTIARDIALALEFLHTAYRQPVIHHDVKSSNVLLDTNFQAKLSDFGLAIIYDVEGDLHIDPTPPSGTRPYMAPEAFRNILSPKIDIYSFGMILFELATGLPPYSSKKKQDLKFYMEDMERQAVNMARMLDPKAQWPKHQGLDGRDKAIGLELLDVAKLATTRDHTRRPDITEIVPKLITVAQKVESR